MLQLHRDVEVREHVPRDAHVVRVLTRPGQRRVAGHGEGEHRVHADAPATCFAGAQSAWYFNAGGFQLPVSGFTHKSTTSSGGVSWSAYRFHEMDPMPFSDGFRFVWRNGDADDPVTGLKCFTETGGRTVGNPTVSNVTAYAWMYTWTP